MCLPFTWNRIRKRSSFIAETLMSKKKSHTIDLVQLVNLKTHAERYDLLIEYQRNVSIFLDQHYYF